MLIYLGSSGDPQPPVRLPIWVSLARGRFAAKTPDFEGWISLDFLGFSRPNRAFSTGYGRSSVENFPRCLLCGVRSAETQPKDPGMRKRSVVHSGELKLFSDYLQAIAARAVF